MDRKHANIGFVATRLARTDGVSLEAVKWAKVLTGMGHTCFAFAGETDWPVDRTCVVAEAHFAHPDVQMLRADLFGAMRTGERSTLIPNVMDFDAPPPTPDTSASELRAALDIGADTHLLLQPTREDLFLSGCLPTGRFGNVPLND